MRHTGTVPLQTDRLLLRPFTLDDCQAAFDCWFGDERVMDWMGKSPTGTGPSPPSCWPCGSSRAKAIPGFTAGPSSAGGMGRCWDASAWPPPRTVTSGSRASAWGWSTRTGAMPPRRCGRSAATGSARWRASCSAPATWRATPPAPEYWKRRASATPTMASSTGLTARR